MKTLSQWLEAIAKTYGQTRGMSDTQRAAYRDALVDIAPHDLEIGFRRLFRTWRFANLLPPPATIRDAVAGAIEEESYVHNPKPKEPPIPRLTLEEAWEDWLEYEKMQAAFYKTLAELGIYTRKPEIPPEPPDQRKARLKKQGEWIKEKYGTGKIVRIRDTSPSKADQGASRTERKP